MSSPEVKHEDLRYWLANEDWDMSQFTRKWLERTAPGDAADALAGIAEDAVPEPRSLLGRFLLIFAVSGFSPSLAIAGKGPDSRKAGTRAALMLAGRDDERCVAPLARVFDPYGFWQSRYEGQIERALTRFLSTSAERGGDDNGRHVADVRGIVERAWRGGRGGGDLSPSLADLLLACVAYLRTVDGPEAEAVLRTLAGAAVTNPERRPNRARIRDAAFAALNPVAVAQ